MSLESGSALLNESENGSQEKQEEIVIERAFVIFSVALFCSSFRAEVDLKKDENVWKPVKTLLFPKKDAADKAVKRTWMWKRNARKAIKDDE